VSSGDWFDWGMTIIEFIEEKDKILEVGFGTGVLHETLVRKGFNLTGIDESVQMVRICNRKLKDLKSKGKIVRGNALRMPFPDRHFNKIVATFPGDFFLEDVFINELERILIQHGEFIALFGVKFNRNNFIDWFYRRIFQVTGQQIDSSIEQKISSLLNKFNGFSNEILWKNYEKRSLCYIKLKKF
jgi:ubiquinone/menaquinone biosynthesis C-methylase UbiE